MMKSQAIRGYFMHHRSIRLWRDEVLNTDEADRILADLSELMFRVSSPMLRSLLMETADEITEMLNEWSDEPTELNEEEEENREAA
jgi:hypothetical protein